MTEQTNPKKEPKKIDKSEIKAEGLEMTKEKNNQEKKSEVEVKKIVKKEEPKKVLESKKKSKKKRQVLKGKANIKCSYNNTVVSLSDLNGNVLAWATSGLLGFKGAKKATPYAASVVIKDIIDKAKEAGIKEVDVFVTGIGPAREAAVRALSANGLQLVSIKDVTPTPHNGCRPKKPRRV